jgi:hypothetical protein
MFQFARDPATDFANAVLVLNQNITYSPASLSPPSSSDVNDSLQNLKSNQPYTGIWNDLYAAFKSASNRFQKRLCSLSGVYIDETSCSSGSSCYASNSWGFRNPTDLTEYLGLSARLWDSNGVAPSFLNYETTGLDLILSVFNTPFWPSGATLPQFLSVTSKSGSNVNNSATTALAALAHEYGHILWFDLVKVSGGASYSYDPTTYCTDKTDGFFAGSWSLSVSRPINFITYGQIYSGDQHLYPPQVADLQNAISSAALYGLGTPQWSTAVAYAAQLLDEFYASEYNDNDAVVDRSGVWASLFGAVSPEEDFVEAFVFHILTSGSSAEITSMPLNIYADGSTTPAYTPDIFADFNKQPGSDYHPRKDKLVKKVVKCIDKDTKW